MLRFRNHIAPSHIHGTGVYTDEAITKGRLIWSFEPGFDLRFTCEEYENLKLDVRTYIEDFAYRSVVDNHYYFSFDNDRFMNHSRTPNTYFGADGNFYAAQDILKGMEITCDYSTFNANWPLYSEIYESPEPIRKRA